MAKASAKQLTEKEIGEIDMQIATEMMDSVITCKVDNRQIVTTRPKGSEVVLMACLCHKSDMSLSFAKGLPVTIARKIIELGLEKWPNRPVVDRDFQQEKITTAEQLVAFISVVVFAKDATCAKMDNPRDFNGVAFTASWALKYKPEDPTK